MYQELNIDLQLATDFEVVSANYLQCFMNNIKIIIIGLILTGIIDEVAAMVEPLHNNTLLQKYFASIISKPGNDLLKFSDEVTS